jgi:branched-chain amino acid transport system permease protein
MAGPDPGRAARVAVVALALAALALPWALRALGLDYYQSLASRIVVQAIAATSLNLVLGYGGMVSFGHAAFFGLGAYATGILVAEGVTSGTAHLVATLVVCGLAAAAIGAISLRTRGVYFIMITLAFAQMLFYFANSVKGYGGDEGLNIRARSTFGVGSAVLDLKDPVVFWYVAVGVLAVSLVALARFVPSRMGRAVLALRDDEVRAEALGFPTYRLKLALFVVAGMLGGIAGALGVNQQGYVSPNLLHWTQSGTLMVMVILGGVATVWGGVAGAAALLLLQEVLGAWTEHWEFWTGWVLLAVVLFARRGLVGMLARPRAVGDAR